MIPTVKCRRRLSVAEAALWGAAVILLLVFVVWPVGSVFAQSFFKNGQFSLRAYEGLLTRNFRLVCDSFRLALAVTLVTVPLSVVVALVYVYGRLPIMIATLGMALLYEAITRRKPSEQFMIRAEYVGFGILILLMVVANLNDILRWLGYM